MAGSSKLVAALVTLLALLGPAAAGSESVCGFVGWPLALLGFNICGTGTSPSTTVPTTPKPAPTGEGLRVGHYNQQGPSFCPTAEQTVKRIVLDAITKNRTVGAGLIRLHFHDCFVRGCDASVLLKTTALRNSNTELTAGPNANSLRGFEVIDAIKEVLENKTDKQNGCPGKVSCADVLALAARDSAYFLGNNVIPYYDVPTGRLDGVMSVDTETNQLPGPDSDIKELNKSFTDQGLHLFDAVTLSAAHSIGFARCVFTRNQPDMDPGYTKTLNAICSGNDDTRVNQDPVTPNDLDNQYYKNIPKFVLFRSDAVLISDDSTRKEVTDNANDQVIWGTKFAKAMVKMGNIPRDNKSDVIRGPEIREKCWQVNGA